MSLRPRRRPLGVYEVGYGRPPRAHQFRTGERSRNPRGRPPRSAASPPADMAKVLTEPVSIKLEGVSQRVPYPVAFLQMLKSRALLGDARAMRMIVELMREVGLLAAMISEEQRQVLTRHANAKEGRSDHLSHKEAVAVLSDDELMEICLAARKER
jgi:hypothetical protein